MCVCVQPSCPYCPLTGWSVAPPIASSGHRYGLVGCPQAPGAHILLCLGPKYRTGHRQLSPLCVHPDCGLVRGATALPGPGSGLARPFWVRDLVRVRGTLSTVVKGQGVLLAPGHPSPKASMHLASPWTQVGLTGTCKASGQLPRCCSVSISTLLGTACCGVVAAGATGHEPCPGPCTPIFSHWACHVAGPGLLWPQGQPRKY